MYIGKIFSLGLSFFQARRNFQEKMGIPAWTSVEEWLDHTNTPVYPTDEEVGKISIENVDIPILDNYENGADESFWEKFPKKDVPKKAKTRLNVRNLEKEIEKVEGKMTHMERKRARKVVKDLREGADAYQKEPGLPPMTAANAKSSYENGPMLTDKLATWIKKDIVAGPFDCPPMEGFRANPLATICKNGKVRPIMNMSGPIGKSFNDNVDSRKLEKVHMSTPKEVGFAIREAGQGAVFSKYDIRDAYKLVPAKPEDLKLQGFKWLNKYFCETQETFGSKVSVCNFDRLANTKDLVVCLNSGTPRNKIHRVLDDSPCVAPATSGITENFSKEMKRFCGSINMPMAPNCSKKEKAFECETEGVVLGIRFNSNSMMWSLPEDKANRVIQRCLDTVKANQMDLNQVQKVMGTVNDLAQMCPIVKFHKGMGYKMIRKFQGRDDILMPVPKEVKKEMAVVAKIADIARIGLPIAEKMNKPPLSALVFYSDAAGASFTKVNGEMHFHDQKDRGVACLGGEKIDEIWTGGKIMWPEGLVSGKRDEKGAYFGCKSTFLESIGLLIPFLMIPELIMGRHIVFKIDNKAVSQGWESGNVKNDNSATEVLKSVAYLAAYTGTRVTVEHVPRVSDEMADLADELSRKTLSKCDRINMKLKEINYRKIDGAVTEWLKNPVSEIDLCQELLKEIKGIVNP